MRCIASGGEAQALGVGRLPARILVLIDYRRHIFPSASSVLELESRVTSSWCWTTNLGLDGL